MLKDSPVPFHADLRPKKVYSFVKKYLKRSGTAFNPVMDRCLMNIAGRILDPLGPLAQLWQDALAAKVGKAGLEPASVIELVRRAIALTGNASYCALVDRRKGLLAKVSSDSLDLIDDPELFVPDSSDLFGKKFEKAFLKELKLSKELDSLVRGKYHGNGNATKQKPFRRQPGRGPGSSTKTQYNYRRNRFPYGQGKPETSSRSKGTKTNRYYAKPSSHLRSKLTEGPESGALQLLCGFKSFENRFSNNYRTTKICRPFGKISSKLESSNPRPRNPRHGCGLQAGTHGSPRPAHKVKAPWRFSLTESKKIEAEISELLQKGALTNVTPDSDRFVSNLFLVPKRDGGSRPVINLKDLNEYLQYNHFKMEGIHLSFAT